MEFTIHNFEAGGVRMRYYTAGAGTPILFLHGGGVRAMTYKKILALLAQKFFIIAPDIPPFGASGMPPTVWDFNKYAHYFSQFLSEQNLENVTVAGHSFGGGIALCLAAQNPRIARTFAIDAAGLSRYPWAKFFWRFFMSKSLYNILRDNFALLFTLQKDFIANILRNALSLARSIKIILHSLNPHYQDTLTRIRTPLLMLWGDRDELFPLAAAEQLRTMVPHAQVKVMHGNHDWCLFNPHLLYFQIISSN